MCILLYLKSPYFHLSVLILCSVTNFSTTFGQTLHFLHAHTLPVTLIFSLSLSINFSGKLSVSNCDYNSCSDLRLLLQHSSGVLSTRKQALPDAWRDQPSPGWLLGLNIIKSSSHAMIPKIAQGNSHYLSDANRVTPIHPEPCVSQQSHSNSNLHLIMRM